MSLKPKNRKARQNTKTNMSKVTLGNGYKLYYFKGQLDSGEDEKLRQFMMRRFVTRLEWGKNASVFVFPGKNRTVVISATLHHIAKGTFDRERASTFTSNMTDEAKHVFGHADLVDWYSDGSSFTAVITAGHKL